MLEMGHFLYRAYCSVDTWKCLFTCSLKNHLKLSPKGEFLDPEIVSP